MFNKKIYLIALLTVLNCSAKIHRQQIINENEHYVWYTVKEKWGTLTTYKNMQKDQETGKDYFVYGALITLNKKPTHILGGSQAQKNL